MGEYRFSIYAKWQLGFSIAYDGQISIQFLFIEIRISTSKKAYGFNIFGYIK